MKDKKAKSSGINAARQWMTSRVSQGEKAYLMEQANVTGLSLSEYVRRKLLGSGPITARVDMMMVNELRRVGGLLKHNFERLRQTESPKSVLIEQEKALAELRKLIAIIGENYDHQKAAEKRNDEIKGAAD